MHGMTEETLAGGAEASICPWCSATYTGAPEDCPSCGATLAADPTIDPSLPGLTAIDAAAIVRAKSEPPKQRNRLLSWISGEYPEPGATATEAAALAPPDLEVRREILRLELEAEVADLQAEADAMLSEATLDGRRPAAVTPDAVPDAAAAESVADPVEGVSVPADAIDAADTDDAKPA